MLRAFSLAMALCTTTLSASAGERTMLDGVVDRATISVHGGSASAAFRSLDDLVEVSIRIVGPSGDGFVTRVVLAQGQSHEVVIDNDVTPDLRFSFRRIGDAVEMTGAAADTGMAMIAQY